MGVSIKGAHAGLWIVSALPSMSPLRIAVIGRQLCQLGEISPPRRRA